jgi:tetratricopeptide (TPR) repeat protein
VKIVLAGSQAMNHRTQTGYNHMAEMTATDLALDERTNTAALETQVSSLALASISKDAQGLLLRMFSDPYLLEKEERASLVSQLERCVAQYPEVSELRVLLAMALCVNFDAQSAIEELRESVRLAPDSFIAQLKFGELWMRLRVIDQAEEHTQLAAKLARNLAQSEMARRQASSIRTMKREGIERGGYGTPLQKLASSLRRVWMRRGSERSTALELS